MCVNWKKNKIATSKWNAQLQNSNRNYAIFFFSILYFTAAFKVLYKANVFPKKKKRAEENVNRNIKYKRAFVWYTQ